jgi:hypothetical protein
MDWALCRFLFLGLATWIGLGSAASCSSDDLAPGGGRVEHPGEPGPKAEPGPTKAPTPPPSLAPPSASMAVTPAPSVKRPRSFSETYEEYSGLKLSSLEKVILDDCPERAWSKNVPKRHCTKDDECGDGFCDRDRCAPLWTCRAEYGRRCEKDDHCGVRPCIEGRCRSCISDAECKRVDIQDGKCTADPSVPGARECSGVVGSVAGDVAPGPPPQRPRQ